MTDWDVAYWMAKYDTLAEYCTNLECQYAATLAKIAELENPWINVKDRVPEHGDTVVIETTPKSYYIATYSINPSGICIEEPGAWFIHNATSMTLLTKGVTHWMPLPKSPPKE